MTGASSPTRWFHLADIASAMAAGLLWYLFPELAALPLVVGLAPRAARLAAGRRPFQATPYDAPLLLFLVAAGIAVWSAYDRETAWAKFWLIVGATVLFYALANANQAGLVRPVGWLAAVFGAGVALYFMATHDYTAVPAKIPLLESVGRALQAPLGQVPGHRLNPNVAGGITALFIPFGAASAVSERGRRRWLAVGLTAVTLLGLLLSTSRGAWMGLAAAGAAAMLALVVGRLVRPAARRYVIGGLAATAAVVVALVILARPAAVIAALEALPSPAAGSSRWDTVRNSLILVEDYPFIGAGLGSYMMLYSTYSFLIHVGYIVHSHTLYLDVAIEQGLPALLSLVVMWGIFALRLWRAAADGRVRPLLAAAALSLVVVLVHGLVDDALYGSRGLLLLFLPLAFGVGEAPEGAPRRAWTVAGTTLLLFAATSLLWAPLQSRWASNVAAVFQSQAELGIYEWPEWPIQDAVRRTVDIGPAVAGFEAALALDPGNASAARRLGQIQLSVGEYRSALTDLAVAYRQRPWDNATRQLYGEALVVNGRIAEGDALWQTVNNVQGQLANRRFWYRHIGDPDRLAGVTLPDSGPPGGSQE